MKSIYFLRSKKYREEGHIDVERGLDLDKGIPFNVGRNPLINFTKTWIKKDVREGKHRTIEGVLKARKPEKHDHK